MKLLKKYVVLFLFFSLSIACGGNQKQRIQCVLENLLGKELFYSSDKSSVLFVKNSESFFINKSSFTILNYVDSLGCTSCQLKLIKWKDFIDNLNTNCENRVQLIFLIHPQKTDEIKFFLEKDKFHYPILVDKNNDFINTNQLPMEMMFQTFLLDKDNRVLAIGNPVHNPKVKELYLKIIQGEKVEQDKGTEVINTQVTIDKTSISLGRFNWQEEQKAIFTLRNTGNKPLVVQDINTSCGCTSVSYPKEPVQSGRELKLEVTYKAEHPEHFNKTVTVYCNAESSPLVLKIMGDAE